MAPPPPASALSNQAVEFLLEHRPVAVDGKPPTKTKIILYYLTTLVLLCVFVVITGLAEWITTNGSLTYLKIELDCVLGKVLASSSPTTPYPNCTFA